jgi:cellulose synthase operon protein C
MLKVECEACKAPYQVDERRIPPTGLKMRCPKCGHAFTVKSPDAAGPPSSKLQGTMIGVAPAATAASKPPLPPPPASKAPLPPSPAAKPAPKPAAPAPLDIGDDLLPQAAAARPAPKKPPPPRAATMVGQGPAPLPIGEIDDLLDLPAMPTAGLPAPVKPGGAAKPPGPAPKAAAAPAVAKPSAGPIPSLSDFEIDLPSATADLPAKPAKPAAPLGGLTKPSTPPLVGGALGIDVDLPIPQVAISDLPRAKPPVPAGKKPPVPGAALSTARTAADLPATRVDASLPAVKNDVGLPALSNNIGLPAPFGDIGLPSPIGGAGLPAPAKGGFGSIDLPSLGQSPGLPVAASGGVGLPAPLDQNQFLPQAAAADAHLPSTGVDNFPAAFGAEMHLPATVDALPASPGEGRYLPQSSSSLPAALGGGGSEFGEVSLDAAPDVPAAAAGAKAVPGGQGGVGYGELDFGAPTGDSVGVEADTSVRASNPGLGSEAAIPMAPAPTRSRDKVVIRPNQGRGVKIAAAAFVALVLGGASLQFTSYGIFGWHAVNDRLHASEWQARATTDLAGARKVIEKDLYDQSKTAADAIATQSTGLPRAYGLTSAAALAEYEFQVRFGRDAARATRADAWLSHVKEAVGAPQKVAYYSAAYAGKLAAQGDLPGARTALEAASQVNAGDPSQEDIAFLRGEVELKAKDSAAAIKAFTRALTIAPSARGHFGLARAYDMVAGQPDAHQKLLAEVAATLAITPKHPGALILKAKTDWEDDRNDTAVIDGLKPLLEGVAKATASPAELSKAYTYFGLAQALRGDTAAARVAFESALQLDSSNVEALLGQGDVFYADGRYTEALSRFDTAAQADPQNPRAIVADAKAKISLERLADAKTQLAAAQKALPKSMIVIYWLGRAEEALGDKKAAEESYVAAIANNNPKDRDAILPYVALSTLLATQGRATEAQAKLDEARAQLPDSAAMEQALGQVAAAQGLFDEAIAHFVAAAQKDVSDLRSRFLLGETYLRMRKLTEAAAEFDKVAAKDPDYPNLAMRRGELLEQSGDLDKALAQFKAALDRAPKDLDLQLRVGAAYVGIGRGKEAEKTLKPVYDARTGSAEVNHYYGRALLLEGGARLPEAMRYLQKAVDIEPSRAEYHLFLAWGANESKDYKLAENQVAKALELDQLLGDAYWQRGVVEEVQGAVDDAIKDIQKGLKLHPTRVEAHATLAKCYADKNMTKEALAEWALATSGGSERPEYEFLYGRLLYNERSKLEALPHVLAAAKAAEAMEQPPLWATQAEFLTGEALLKQGNKVDAKEHLIRFVAAGERSSPDRADAIAAIHSIDPAWRPNP